MAGHAVSEQVKKIRGRRALNARLQAAVDEYNRQKHKPKKLRLGLRRVATKHGVNHTTLSRLAKGRVSMSAFNASKKKLTDSEERVLVNLILESADRGLPMTRKAVTTAANNILKAKKGEGYVPVGHNWVERFLDRYEDEIDTHWSRPLDTQRARALNPEVVQAWFKLVKERLVDADVRPEDMYGMDESGFPPSDQGTQCVVGRKGTKRQHKQGTANRENVTVLVTICADGTRVSPCIIFKAKNFLSAWRSENVAGAAFACSENGWTDGSIARHWLEEVFDKETREKAGGRKRVLFMDGHNSHYTPELLQYAIANNIEIIGYPPHCTHALQGLDVACFAKMKECWKRRINQFEEVNCRGINKADFAREWGMAFLEAFTPDLVRAAFSSTGLHPFNANVITPQQMKPSEATSTQGSFPQPQSTPVRAVMAAYRYHRPTRLEMSPTTHQIPATPLSRLQQPLRLQQDLDPNIDPMLQTQSPMLRARLFVGSSPPARTPKRARDTEVDPSLYTPSKRTRLLVAGLSESRTGSYLIAKTPLTATQARSLVSPPVLELPACSPEPGWSHLRKSDDELAGMSKDALLSHAKALAGSLGLAKQQIHARNLVIEGCQAQLVVQNMTLERMAVSLEVKEIQTKSERLKIFEGGKGLVLTDAAVVAKIQAQKDKRASELAAQEQTKAQRAEKKVEKARLDAEWTAIKENHQKAVDEWEENCQQLIQRGTLKKDLPKRPLRPRKPKASTEAEAAVPTEANQLQAEVAGNSDSEDDDEIENDDEFT